MLDLTRPNLVCLLGLFDCFADCADASIASSFFSCSYRALAFLGLDLLGV